MDASQDVPAVVSAQGLTGCIIGNCGKKIRARGRCHRHYYIWYRATKGTERPPALNLKRKTVAERFHEKVTRLGPDDCWPWKASAYKSGHGEFFVSPERGKVPAHTFARELATGIPCPAGREGCHRCDNPPCCNPAHVYYGTRQENVDDMWARGRSSHGSAHPMAKVTEPQVLAIRERFAAGEFETNLAREYGLSDSTVSNIVNGRIWKHVGGPIKVHGRPGRRPSPVRKAA
jgi:hypothetical protein